ncbi:proline-rich receptor-like protein kinase PERK2 [Iris pallida]|uniref:Proline-rich receptor-like protein kinase PERK2 n=1 Tax=Iris pallida TaxID=29817 RepID=A0AAX6EAE3_IRIPA|nr:proline-rich receptor-like protein kinase PERK2 [Iris pallida]
MSVCARINSSEARLSRADGDLPGTLRPSPVRRMVLEAGGGVLNSDCGSARSMQKRRGNGVAPTVVWVSCPVGET